MSKVGTQKIAPQNVKDSAGEQLAADTKVLGVEKDATNSVTKNEKKAKKRRRYRKNRAEMKKLNSLLEGLLFGVEDKKAGEDKEGDKDMELDEGKA